ncbi:hypothetical protein NLJ89_g2568 [Agrocybe chaxingu]|uniref:N-acetyltransferase ECO1 n=1 Tax=Agrocybe chaxingu TaxID=84603 RepID=A0A9W8K5M6_9AGAR|nr:hypothetical protein NLJ89_g2568 [Agrocybe chaxingu]
MSSKIQRTYSRSRHAKAPALPPSSPPSTLSSSPPATPAIPRPSKRPISEVASPSSEDRHPPLFPLAKRTKLSAKSSITTKSKSSLKTKNSAAKSSQQKTLTQLHFNIDQSILRTCAICDLSYTKGASGDEALHRAHCAKVQQGTEWGREEEKDRIRNGENAVKEVVTDVKLRGRKKKGRVICISADIDGKIGAKVRSLMTSFVRIEADLHLQLSTILQTVNTALSSSELSPAALQCSKAYLFLIPHDTIPNRERIAGCVIAQRITTALVVISPPSSAQESPPLLNARSNDLRPPFTTSTSSTTPRPVVVGSDSNIFCDPTPLPTPMGISRMFVHSAYRRLGIAQALLDAAAATFIHGCPLDPLKGEVAFSQPTGSGQAVMEKWGKGAVRVFEDDD